MLQVQRRPGLSAAGASSSALPSCRALPEPPALQGASPWHGLRPGLPQRGLPPAGGTEGSLRSCGTSTAEGCLSRRRRPGCGIQGRRNGRSTSSGRAGAMEEPWDASQALSPPSLSPHLPVEKQGRQGLKPQGGLARAGGRARDAVQSSFSLECHTGSSLTGTQACPLGMDAGPELWPGPHPARPQ